MRSHSSLETSSLKEAYDEQRKRDNGDQRSTAMSDAGVIEEK